MKLVVQLEEGIKARIEAVIEIVVVGTVGANGCLFATSRSRRS